MRSKSIIIAVSILTLVNLVGAPASSAAPPRFQHLDPGGQPRLTERVPVNVVFVGYEQHQVNRSQYRAVLPQRYEPVVRSRLSYGIVEKLGLRYSYDYRINYTDRAYEDRFFGELTRLATPAPLTAFQQQYNDQAGNVLTVENNHFIDAPSVERWLAFHPPAGVDTRRNTIFFINWYGRSDFKFHVYTKMDEPDPDTGYNFGDLRASRKIIAWGGTTARDEENGLGSTRRIWFHDLSAGPESWTANWNVDDTDLDGNGVEDYRMPAIWEYAANGYRQPGALGRDLGLITRYVALNLLFTSSPLYPAELPTSQPPTSINLDSNTYEGWPGVDASTQYLKPGLLLDELRELRWSNTLDYDSQDLPFTGEASRCYFLVMEQDESCYPQLGYPPFANFFLQNTFELERTRDDQGRVDYELPIFNYAVGEDVDVPALGFADDNYRDGTQSYVFAFVSPDVVASGYGLTTTLIHEVGHHVGMSHPHDGYDSTSGIDYGPEDQFFFVWAGDEHNSMMSYIDLNWDFSQFDHDNSNRFLAAAYNEAANGLAEAVLADPDAARASDELRVADRLLGRAKAALANHEYVAAHALARLAYEAVAAGARQVGVPVSAHVSAADANLTASPNAKAVHEAGEFIDTLQPGNGPRSQP
jgi:hypothetical protein